jgi:lysophospholipase L1-like esterase
MRKLSSTVVAVALITSMLQVVIPAVHAGSGATVSYLALGDSLSVGFQPGPTVNSNGYVDDLYGRMEPQIPGLSLKNVGCAGETSRSLITGKHSPCHYAAGSQLDAAVAFLQAHPGQVAFITIDIGANDLLYRCLDFRTGLFGRACSVDLFPRLQSRVTRIVDALGIAAGPGVPIVAMSYYDPFLGFWGLVPGGRHAARADQRIWTLLNAALTTGYEDAGATVADVAATFKIDDFTNTVVVPGRGRIPMNVAIACRWTWFCSAKFFTDPHANDTGYRKIARTFARELKDLLP